MKLVPWLKFDKQNKLTAKLFFDDAISAHYDVIIHCLEYLVYNFLRFAVQTLKNVSLDKYKLKP